MKTIAKLMALCLVLGSLSFAQGGAPAGKTDDTKKPAASGKKAAKKGATAKAKGGDKDKDKDKGKGKGKGKAKGKKGAEAKGGDDKGGKK